MKAFSQGRRALAAVLICSLLAPAGCAAVFASGPPANYEQLEQIECREAIPALAADAVILGGSLLIFVVASGADDRLGIDGGEWAIPAATATVSATSLFIAARRIRDCHRAQRALQKKREERERTSAEKQH